MNRIGVTGGKGFIGSYLVEALEDPIVFEGDLLSLNLTRDFVRRCDMIYHIAGKNREIPGVILHNNLVATGNLILSMILENYFPAIIFVSSSQVEWDSPSEYSLSKYIEEQIIRDAPHYCIYRVPNVYGPGARPYYNSVVATFCTQIAKGEKLTINDPNSEREFVYIDDLIYWLLKPEFNNFEYRIDVKGEVLSIGEIASFLTDRLGEHKRLEKTLNWYIEEERNGKRLSYP
jgi:UDP-2-acetamido-2,6-beta-L-arabino-hexul-4-ose reductase